MKNAPRLLGSFVLAPESQSLVHERTTTPLRPKAWQVLLYFAERPGELVTGRELFDHVWADVAVTPKTLTNVINELRRALAEDSSVRIETRHRRGYRLVIADAAVTAASELPRPRDAVGIFVGREGEIEQLTTLWRHACQGHRQVVLLGGFAGIGKTTLVEVFQAELRGMIASTRLAPKPPVLVRGICMDHQSDPEPYGPIAEALDGVHGQCDIVSLLQRCAPSWLARMPWLLPADEMARLRLSLAGIGTSRVLREAMAALEAIAAEQPLLLVLEDLHHADAATLDLVTAIAQRDGAARLMILATYRTHAATSAVRESINRITRLPSVTCRTLDALTAKQVRAYLEHRLGDATLCDRLAPVIEAKTGGNALFVRETVDAMIERQWLVHGGDGWRLTVAIADIGVLIPDSARALIGQHAEQLDPEARELLEAASMVGEEFTDKVVAAACGRPVESVSSSCQRLADRGPFIRLVDQRLLPDGLPWSLYRFSHALYRQGVADRVPPAQRRAYHERIGEQLAREYGACLTEVAPRLAMHFGEAGHWDRQVEYLDLAARDAMERAAHAEAAALLQTAIAVVEQRSLPPTDATVPAEARALAVPQAERYIIYGLLRLYLSGLADPQALEAFDRGFACADRYQLAIQRFRAQMGRCSTRAYGGRAQEAMTIAVEMIATAEASHPELLAVACHYGMLTASRLGNYRDAVELGKRAHDALPGASPAVPKNFHLEPEAESGLCYALTIVGDPETAAIHRDNALAALRRRSTPYDTVVVLDQLSHTAVLAGDAPSALAFAQQLNVHALHYGFDGHLATAAAYHTWALCRLGTAAVADYDSAISRRAKTPQRWHQSVLLAYLAELYLRQGDSQRAAATMRQIDPEPAFEAEIWRVRGDILRAEGQNAPARDCYATAVRIAQQQGAGLFERRAAECLEACE